MSLLFLDRACAAASAAADEGRRRRRRRSSLSRELRSPDPSSHARGRAPLIYLHSALGEGHTSSSVLHAGERTFILRASAAYHQLFRPPRRLPGPTHFSLPTLLSPFLCIFFFLFYFSSFSFTTSFLFFFRISRSTRTCIITRLRARNQVEGDPATPEPDPQVPTFICMSENEAEGNEHTGIGGMNGRQIILRKRPCSKLRGRCRRHCPQLTQYTSYTYKIVNSEIYMLSLHFDKV